MHLIARGIGKHIYDLIMVDITKNSIFYYTNTDSTVNSTQYPFYISKTNLLAIGSCISQSRKFIPTSFQGSFDDVIRGIDGTRAVDWLDFLLYIVPTVVVPCLSTESCKQAVLALVRGCSIALQWELTHELIDDMEK
jgi:hypothetical protein